MRLKRFSTELKTPKPLKTYHHYDNYYHHHDNKMNFLKTIEQNKELRRIFGERELIIIRKQLLGVPLKPSEKTRLSRDIKKKLEAIKILSPFEKEFNLKRNAIIKKKIQETKEAILTSKYRPLIKKITLFGSAAEKKMTFRSDIDIAVEFNKINEKEAIKFRLDILGKVDSEKMDIQVFNVLPNKLKKEIKEKGITLYER